MRVLLTGGTGLIGSPTLKALRSAGHQRSLAGAQRFFGGRQGHRGRRNGGAR